MSPAQALRLLGLAAGADATAIRKAYAAKLKAMDVDADPDGYARLRQARDTALRAARKADAAEPAPALQVEPQPGQEPDPEPEAEPEATPAAAWAYAAPMLAGQVAVPDGSGIAADLDRAPPPLPDDPVPAVLAAPAPPPGAQAAFAGPPLLLAAAPPPEAVGTLARPDRELARLLHDAQRAGEPLAAAESAQARRALDAMLADAARADLTTHGRIENWLADLLAETWPRSADLLEPAAAAFGWENERGRITERPSIAWLNARLRGLRFQQKAEAPDHPLHKAWVELHRPGWSSWLDRRRTSRKQVNELLAGVRKHFPELEAHFDPQRVASWESAGAGIGKLFGVRAWWFYAFLLLQAVNVLSHCADDAKRSPVNVAPDPLTSVTAPADPDYDRVRDRAIVAAFGADRTIDWLRAKQPSFAATFEANLRAQRRQASNDDDSVARAVDQVRRLTYLAGRERTDALRERTMALHLAQIDAASARDPQACIDYLRTGSLFQVPVPDRVRSTEQALGRAMVEAGALVPPPPHPPAQASIPGKLISRIIADTTLGEASVRAALQDKGSAAERCAVQRALLANTLRWRGPERAAILRIL